MGKRKSRRPGVGVDAYGGSTIDPTQNVKDLTEAANVRQDDLREANDRLLQWQITSIGREIILRSEHYREIRNLESERLDKIRQVDVLAGNTAAERALIAIQTLATQTTAERETLRSMVANTATTIAAQTSETVSQLNSRISQLEKSSYEGAGKSSYVDPMMGQLVEQVKMLAQASANTTGNARGKNEFWGYIVAGAAILFALLTYFKR
jgi:type VI protein secretion system component VasK